MISKKSLAKVIPYIAIFFVAIVATILSIRFEAFERFYEFTRAHEDWELDELATVWFWFITATLSVALVQAREEILRNRQNQERIERMSRYDLLTGLHNRSFFETELSTRLATASLGAVQVAVVVLDLDQLKPVNDLSGYEIGDRIVQETADRLRLITSDNDLVSRIGGGEFALTVTTDQDANELLHLMDSILQSVSKPITLDNRELSLTATAGLAVFPADATDVSTLLQQASLAMRESKAKGRNTVTFFNAELESAHRELAQLQLDIRQGIQQQEFVPFFQPLVALDNDRLSGFEVLARWDHPTKGVQFPNLFLTVLEDLDLMDDMFWGLLQKSCQAARSWSTPLSISVNLSPHQFLDEELGEKILKCLSDNGLSPERLILEVTENALFHDLDTTRNTIIFLKSHGIRFSLDDFGAGYASFHHLNQLPFDTIKIDGEFIAAFKDDIESFEIMSSIISLCQNLGKNTTAECVEHEDDVKWLKSLGCTYAQGYLFSKAVNAEHAYRIAEHWAERDCKGPLLVDLGTGPDDPDELPI